MTKIKLDCSNNNRLTVNGRFVDYAGRISSLTKTGSGQWHGHDDHGNGFRIVGGRASGGAPNEWMLQYSAVYGSEYIFANSAVECVKLIITA